MDLHSFKQIKRDAPLHEALHLMNLLVKDGEARRDAFSLPLAELLRDINRRRPTSGVRMALECLAVFWLFRACPDLYDTPALRFAEVEVQRRRFPPLDLLLGAIEEGDVPKSGVAYHALMGGLSLSAHNWQAAYEHFNNGRLVLRHWGGVRERHYLQGLNSTRALADLVENGSGAFKVPSFQSDGDKLFSSDKPIVMVCFDASYFRSYAHRLLDSANGSVNFHFHIANPEPQDLIVHPDVRYSFHDLEHGASPPYYASMRFLIMRDVLNRYNAPLLTVDADSFFEGSPEGLFAHMADADIGMNMFYGYPGQFSWRHFNAQQFFARPTRETEEFARAFERQFSVIYNPDAGMQNWFIDQALLTSAYAECAVKHVHIRIGDNEWGRHTRLKTGEKLSDPKAVKKNPAGAITSGAR